MAASVDKVQKKLDKEIRSIFKGLLSKKTFQLDELTFSAFLANKLFVIYLIREGVPYSLFDIIQDYAPLSEIEWSDILDISTKSLQRYKQSDKQFGPLQSEKIIEMAEVTSLGLDVFGNMEKFKLWLDTPNFALGKLKPVELLKDSYGKEMVVGELTRINYGILA
ncbi:MAG: antitoxin [Bacteroidetes bacterium]|nr:MAG: antitoxin [Bacteroidota bacterium]